MGRSITFAPEEFYHIYNRGTEKRNIFLDEDDYNRFLTLIFAVNGVTPVDLKLQGSTLYKAQKIDRGESLVFILGYVLMPNHFHILMKQNTDGGIATFMQKLGTAYTMYFNSKNERGGALFQGKFKAKHVINDVYLQYLLSYIHLNPIKLIEPNWKEDGINNLQKAEQHLMQYKYSSFIDYCGVDRIENIILQKNLFPTTLSVPNDFKRSVDCWLRGRTL